MMLKLGKKIEHRMKIKIDDIKKELIVLDHVLLGLILDAINGPFKYFY